ncbi:MAG: FliH/SctL family protein [Rickettsiaceae bacterium]
MPKYKHFELEDLAKDAVVNSTNNNLDDNSDVNNIINEVITEHINTIVENADHQANNESSQAITMMTKNKSDNDIDLETIKAEAFANGFEQARVEYESKIDALSKDRNFVELVEQKLSDIISNNQLDIQVAQVSADAIASIAKKLHLILPADFEMIVKNGLLTKLKKFYKEGDITLTVHPDRYNLAQDLFQSDIMPNQFKGNFHIVQDDTLRSDDCRMEWQDRRLEYNQEQLSVEIDKILQQLKKASKV